MSAKRKKITIKENEPLSWYVALCVACLAQPDAMKNYVMTEEDFVLWGVFTHKMKKFARRANGTYTNHAIFDRNGRLSVPYVFNEVRDNVALFRHSSAFDGLVRAADACFQYIEFYKTTMEDTSISAKRQQAIINAQFDMVQAVLLLATEDNPRACSTGVNLASAEHSHA
jgi:hypothetical protein